MSSVQAEPLRIQVDADQSVGGLLLLPPHARSCFVFAHGAGAGMTHSFMEAFARGLAERGIGSLRYQFGFVERGSKRPDPPAQAHAAVRAAVAAATQHCAGCSLIAGGKSYGGRMTSQAQAARPLPAVCAIAFVGFPLHPAGKPSSERAEHLDRVALPMLFLQGTRDELAGLDLVRPLVARLGPKATLSIVDDADHAFHVRARSGGNDAAAMQQMLDVFSHWAATVTGAT